MSEVSVFYRIGAKSSTYTHVVNTSLDDIQEHFKERYYESFRRLRAEYGDTVVYRVPAHYKLHLEPEDTLAQRVDAFLSSPDATDMLRLGRQKLSTIFDGETLDEDHIRLIFQCTKVKETEIKPPEDNGILLSMSRELDIARGYAAGTSAPSTIAKSVTNFIKSQEGHPIYNGRQGRIGPSVTLFSSPLAHFAEDMKHVDDYTYEDETDYDGDSDEGDSEAISKALLQVIAAVSDIHTKEVLLARDINDNLSLLLGARIHQSKNSNSDREPDGRTVASPACAPTKSATVGVIVFKLGIAAGDALVQASAIWRDEAFCDAYKCFQTVSACPAFLVSLQGQYLSIQGAVLIPRPVTEHLTDTIYMGLGAPCEQRVRRLRRILRIFRKAHRALRDYYVNLVPNADAPYMGWKPQPTFFRDISDEDREVVKNLEYLSLFNHEDRNKDDFQRSLYIGTLSGKKVVVKFCERYCPEAHRLLADKFAPGMHMCTRLVGGQHMVVMDYVEGNMVSTAFREGKEVRLSLQFHDQVKTALDVLHENGYVYGDLRGPNILKTGDDRAILIDFDWAGKEGEARYSVLMNTDLTWPKGASRGGLIHKQHDWDMLARMYPGRVEEGTVEEGTVEEGTGRIERVEEGVSRVAKHTLEDGDGGSSSRRLRTDGDGLDSIEDPEDIMEVDVEAG